MVVSEFMQGTKEIEFDAVAMNGEVVEYAISEHIEFAGVHSGDATLVFPAQKIYFETARRIKKVSKMIAKELNISGPFNIQFLAKNNFVKVIECNLRASRSFPFVSKVLKRNFIETATRIMLDAPYTKPDKSAFDIDWIGIKASQFSFARLHKADPVLGVDMSSTGEVGCIGVDKGAGQTGVRDQWNVMIDRRTADLIAIGQLTFAMIFRDIYYQFESVIAEHIHDVQITFLIRPANGGCLDSIIVQELGGSVRTIDRRRQQYS